MDLVIQCLTKKYARFSGRAPRKEYWLFVLFYVIATLSLGYLDLFLGTIDSETGAALISLVFSIAVFIPSIAVSVRRLHDINQSGWLCLIAIIPIIGVIVLIVLFCIRGTEDENRFG